MKMLDNSRLLLMMEIGPLKVESELKTKVMKRTCLQKNSTCPDFSGSTDKSPLKNWDEFIAWRTGWHPAEISNEEQHFEPKEIQHVKSFARMKNLKIQFFILLLGFIGLNGFAQQDPMYTQYMNNPIIVNPAYAGSADVGCLTGVFRKQWVGIDGAPTTSSLSYNAPIKKYNFGVGVNLLYDALGPTTQTGFYLDYSYLIRFEKNKTLSLGLKGGFNYFYLNYSKLTYNDPDIDINPLENESLFMPNFGIGAYYYSNKYFVGISVPKLIRNSLEKKENTLTQLNRQERHVFLMGGYYFTLSEHIDLKPSFIVRYVNGAPLSIELSAAFILYDKVWLGAMYRFDDSFGGVIRWQVNQKLDIGYSYDFSNSRMNAFNRGTHEISLGYRFIKNNQKVQSPRYF